MNLIASAPVTFTLLVVNVGLSLYVLLARPDLFARYALRPREVLHGREWDRVVLSAFLHVGIGHLLFNMVSLYFFGPVLEALLGPWRFAILYIGSLLTASALTLWLQRGAAEYSAVGASGAISGVIFAFCLFAPFEKIYLLFALPLPAIVFALLYVIGSAWAIRQGRTGGDTGGIAHEAHLGGALGGLLITVALVPAVVPHFLHQIGLLG